MGPDLVEDVPVGFGLAVQVTEVGDLVGDPVEVLVFQGAECPFADAVLSGALGPGANVQQLGAGGNKPGERGSLERAAG